MLMSSELLSSVFCISVYHCDGFLRVLCSPDGIDGDQVGQLAVITRSNFMLFKEAVNRCVYSDSDHKVAFAGVGFLQLSPSVVSYVSVLTNWV